MMPPPASALFLPEERGNLTRRKLGDLLPPNAVYISFDGSILAATTMFDHGISWLRVVDSKNGLQPVGCLPRARIGNRMIQKMNQGESSHTQAQTA